MNLHSSSHRSIYLKVISALVILCNGLNIIAVSSQSVVEYLPGYAGKLPFNLETGYIGVGESEERQFFYYFVESEDDPENDPLMLWLTGGPGCSGLSALAFENGPISFDPTESDGSIPKFTYNPYSWTKMASIIFVDQPAGTGFSYATTREAYYTSDSLNSQHTYEFLRKWLLSHPKYLKNPLYIGGDSYGGKFVPLLVDKVFEGNDAGIEPQLNIKGYIEGNPVTDKIIDQWAVYPYAHRMALLSDNLFRSASESCNGDFYNPNSSSMCQNYIQRIEECLERVTHWNILEPWCANNALKNRERSLLSLDITQMNPLETPLLSECDSESVYGSAATWTNVDSVRRALRIRKGTVREWVRCNSSYKSKESEVYEIDVDSVVPNHKRFTRKDCRALIFSGDHDMVVPHLGTERWIESLGLHLQSDWRPWFVQGQTAGYTMRYGNGRYNLSYATIRNTGHVALQEKPLECFGMIQRWLSFSDL